MEQSNVAPYHHEEVIKKVNLVVVNTNLHCILCGYKYFSYVAICMNISMSWHILKINNSILRYILDYYTL